MKRAPCYVTGLLIFALGCGATNPDQSLFLLSAAWGGQVLTLDQTLAFGEMQINLTGTEDGPVEEYEGEGTIFGSRFNSRMRQIEATFDTTANTIEMTIIDFPVTGAVLAGSFDGQVLLMSDSTFCICSIRLTR